MAKPVGEPLLCWLPPGNLHTLLQLLLCSFLRTNPGARMRAGEPVVQREDCYWQLQHPQSVPPAAPADFRGFEELPPGATQL